MKKIIAAFLFLLLFFNDLYATTIIIHIKDNIITIGADSKVVNFGILKNRSGQIITKSSYSNICKIHQMDDMIYTSAGYAMDEIVPVVNKIFRRTKDLNTKNIQFFKMQLAAKLSANLRQYERYNKPLYNMLYTQKGIGNVIFCYFDQGIATIKVLTISLLSKNSKVNLSITQNYDMGDGTFFFGEYGVAQKYLSDNQYFFYNANRNTADLISDLIAMEIKDKPNIVGLPINVVELRYNLQPDWIYLTGCNM